MPDRNGNSRLRHLKVETVCCCSDLNTEEERGDPSQKKILEWHGIFPKITWKGLSPGGNVTCVLTLVVRWGEGEINSSLLMKNVFEHSRKILQNHWPLAFSCVDIEHIKGTHLPVFSLSVLPFELRVLSMLGKHPSSKLHLWGPHTALLFTLSVYAPAWEQFLWRLSDPSPEHGKQAMTPLSWFRFPGDDGIMTPLVCHPPRPSTAGCFPLCGHHSASVYVLCAIWYFLVQLTSFLLTLQNTE